MSDEALRPDLREDIEAYRTGQQEEYRSWAMGFLRMLLWLAAVLLLSIAGVLLAEVLW